jgi:hypothetical protein
LTHIRVKIERTEPDAKGEGEEREKNTNHSEEYPTICTSPASGE